MNNPDLFDLSDRLLYIIHNVKRLETTEQVTELINLLELASSKMMILHIEQQINGNQPIQNQTKTKD